MLGEASTDPIWGVGLKLSNPALLTPNTWTGQNLMGTMLMTVRDEFK